MKILTGSVRAGILPLVLGISVIMSAVCSSLILYVHYGQSLSRKIDLEESLLRNCDSGIEFLLASGGTPGESFELDLFQDGKDSARLSRSAWGMYEVLISLAHRGVHKREKIVMTARVVDSVHKSSLYLTGTNSPLYLAGDTKLKGTVYLPQSGVRPGSAGDSWFEGEKLIDGTKLKSGAMPSLRTGLTDILNEYRDSDILIEKQWSKIEELPDSLFHSFASPHPLFYSTSRTLELTQNLEGMVLVHSTTSIRVTSTAKLRNVILVSPRIEIEGGFKGSLQAVSDDVIIVGEGSRLEYPSCLALKPERDESKIELGKGTLVQGDILIEGKESDPKEGILVVRAESRIEGFAHVEGAAEVGGTIKGHLSCEKFQISTGSETLGNYIKDGEFDYGQIPGWLSGSGLWQGKGSIVLQALK